jgi:hypothetical protein
MTRPAALVSPTEKPFALPRKRPIGSARGFLEGHNLMRFLKALVAGCLVASGWSVAGAPPASEPKLPELNAKVVEFARSSLGKKVGDGECLSLAIKALDRAGATGSSLREPNGDYVWGQPVPSIKNALPGDVLQFRDAVFKGKKYVTKRRWISWHYEYPHHTAIVSGVSEGGNVLTILHQNVGGPNADEDHKRMVQEGTLRVDSLQPGGWVRAYRPVSEASQTSEEAP